MITYAERVERKRRVDVTAFFGCSKCGGITRAERDSNNVTCAHCRASLSAQGNTAPLQRGGLKCPYCGALHRCESYGELLNGWNPVLVQRVCSENGQRVLHMDLPTPDEVQQALSCDSTLSSGALLENIPWGTETARLRRWSYSTWRDLYPPRQLLVYLEAAKVVDRLFSEKPTLKRRLLLMICSSVEMAGFCSRWDRYHLKAFEAVANHRFSSTPLAVEVNPLGPRGRGTLRRRLIHSTRAASWCSEVMPEGSAKLVLAPSEKDTITLSAGPVVVCGSSDRLLLPDSSVDIIVTDPPYYDSVQYGELASLFTAWGYQLGLWSSDLQVDLSGEAVPNRSRNVTDSAYRDTVCRVFAEARRCIKPEGRLILTYRSSSIAGWAAIADALRDAGFHIAALATVHSENETDHSKRYARSFSSDLVIECSPSELLKPPAIVTPPRTPQEKELVIMGEVIAGQSQAGKETLTSLFHQKLQDRGIESHFIR